MPARRAGSCRSSANRPRAPRARPSCRPPPRPAPGPAELPPTAPSGPGRGRAAAPGPAHFSFFTLLCRLFWLILALILVVFEIRLGKNRNKMVSVLQNVKATMAWRKHQLLADLDENESPVPDKLKRRASLSSLNTIRMSLRKRVPLKQIELNFRKTTTWESLEARQKSQPLQSIKRTAKNAFGTMSQVLCSGAWIVFASTSVLRLLDSVRNAVLQGVYPICSHSIMVVS